MQNESFNTITKNLLLFSIILAVNASIYLFLENQITAQFYKKSEAITNNIAKAIQETDQEMGRALKNAAMLVLEYMRSHPDMNRDELITLRDKTETTTISIFDEEGRFYLTSSDALNPQHKLYSFYKNMSVLSKEFIQKGEVVSTITACISAKARPDTFIILPIHLTLPRNISNKVAVIYDAELKKLIDVSYNRDDTDKILTNSIESQSSILQLSLLDANNNTVSRSIKNPDLALNNSEDNIEIKIKFDNRTDIAEISANDSPEYFYVLTVLFSSKELKHQILTIKLLFSIVTLLALIIVYLIGGQIRAEQRKNLLIQNFTAQIHHDIMHSLWALQLLTDQIEEDGAVKEEDMHNIKDVMWSIKAITENLSSNYYTKLTRNERKVEMIYPILNKVVQIYRKQYKENKVEINFQLKKEHYGLFCLINQSEFERIISNIIQNAIEAVSQDKRAVINIILEKTEQHCVIKIENNGIEIPRQVITEIEKGIPIYSKSNNQGFGLSYAVKVIKDYLGSIKIESGKDGGSTIIINIPLSNVPNWFLPKIDLQPGTTIVILADIEEVHNTWREKLKNYPKIKEIVSLYSLAELNKFIIHYSNFDNKQARNILYIIDHPLKGTNDTGLEFIQEYQLQNQAILYTNKALRDKWIVEVCNRSSIKLLPKSFIEIIEID